MDATTSAVGRINSNEDERCLLDAGRTIDGSTVSGQPFSTEAVREDYGIHGSDEEQPASQWEAVISKQAVTATATPSDVTFLWSHIAGLEEKVASLHQEFMAQRSRQEMQSAVMLEEHLSQTRTLEFVLKEQRNRDAEIADMHARLQRIGQSLEVPLPRADVTPNHQASQASTTSVPSSKSGALQAANLSSLEHETLKDKVVAGVHFDIPNVLATLLGEMEAKFHVEFTSRLRKLTAELRDEVQSQVRIMATSVDAHTDSIEAHVRAELHSIAGDLCLRIEQLEKAKLAHNDMNAEHAGGSVLLDEGKENTSNGLTDALQNSADWNCSLSRTSLATADAMTVEPEQVIHRETQEQWWPSPKSVAAASSLVTKVFRNETTESARSKQDAGRLAVAKQRPHARQIKQLPCSTLAVRVRSVPPNSPPLSPTCSGKCLPSEQIAGSGQGPMLTRRHPVQSMDRSVDASEAAARARQQRSATAFLRRSTAWH